MNIFEFMSENPWQTFFLGPITFVSFFVIVYYLWLMYNRAFRFITIWFRGWPPEHIDADGDWKTEEKED